MRDGHEELVFNRASINSSISPDGARVALTEKINDQNSLNLVSLPEGNVIRTYKLAQPKENVICIVWSRDGKYLAYVLFDDTGSHTSIWIQPLETEMPRKITELSEQEVFESSGLALSPDGKTVAASQGTWRHDAVLIRGLR